MYSEFRAKIQAWLDKGESVQIVAPYGYGKSRFGKSLGGLLIDPNLLQTPQEIIGAIKNSTERKLIVIDSCDRILTSDYLPLFNYLKALRDEHKYSLAYVFLSHTLLDSSLLGDLAYLASEHLEYLPALEPEEYDLFGFVPTPKQHQQLVELSRGIPALVKAYVLAMRDNQSLDPKENISLANVLEKTGHLKMADLSASETRLFELLLSHKGQIVSKNQIAESVYPDVKNLNGISDHSLDQLVHRLRNKIKSKHNLTTHRGLGYKLN